VVDMAVGLVTGSAFTAIVTSLVNDVISPVLGIVVGGLNFSDYKLVLRKASVDAAGTEIAEVALKYGSFIQAIFNFLIVSLVIFFVVKAMNKMRESAEVLAKKNEEEQAIAEEAAVEEVKPSEDVMLLTEIRDLLKAQK